MLCHGKPQKSIWSKYKIGGAQLQYQTKFPLKFCEIPSNGLGGVTDTRCVPPFHIHINLYTCILLSPCYAMGNPKNQSDQNIK